MESPPEVSSMLVLISGLPGTGKTTFARVLAEKMEARHVNTDILRHQTGLLGKYDLPTKQKIYFVLLERTRKALEAGKVVLVDATFYKNELRQPFIDLAHETGRPVHFIHLDAGEKTIQERMETRRLYSEADFDVYEKIREVYEPLQQEHLHLQTDQLTLEEMLTRAIQFLKDNA